MPTPTLTHNQCRARVCIICFEVKKNSRLITDNSEWIEKFKENIGVNFDITNPRLPNGLCNSCRLKYFSKTKAKETSFKIPDYLHFVVAPENSDEPSQQVEVLPSLVRDCKKPYHRNRLFWGSGIGYF